MVFTFDDLARLQAILRHAARQEIMPRFARLAADDIRVKTHLSDFVTIADEAAEALIAHQIEETFGDCLFIGEELIARGSPALDQLADAPLAIVIDPIDGTFNYANALPAFAVIAAVVEHGITTAGIILDPVREDAALSLKGHGAFGEDAHGRRAPLSVAAPLSLAAMHGIASWTYMEEPLRSRVLSGLAGVWGAYNYRCGGQEMRLLARGGAHFALYNKLSPWDHAAGVLIHQEAGGFSAHFDGTPYQPTDRTGGLLMAPDAASWRALHAQLIG